MKVPEYIRYKMHRAARLHAEAARLMSHVDAWFEDRGYNMEELRCGDGCSLEELDYGNDIADEFCERIENGDFCSYGERKDNG